MRGTRMETVVFWIGLLVAIMTGAYNFLQARNIQAEVDALSAPAGIEAPAEEGVSIHGISE